MWAAICIIAIICIVAYLYVMHPSEGMCGSYDQLCKCSCNETMVGTNDPHDLTSNMISKAMMGY